MQPETKPQTGAIAALLLLVVIWGLTLAFMKLALRDLPAFTLVALRYLTAAPFFAVFLLGRKLPGRRALGAMALAGVLGIDVGQVLQGLGLALVSASVATIISATIPIFTVLLAARRLGQPVGPGQIAGLLLALGGIATIALRNLSGVAGELNGTALLGDALALGSAIFIANYYVRSAALAAAHGPMTVAACSSIAGALPLAPIAAVQLWAHPPAQVSWVSIAVVLYIGLCTTVLGFWIWMRALRALPTSIAASSQYLQPLVGILASAALFGDPLDRRFLVGSVLVFAGIALTALTRRWGWGRWKWPGRR